ncbi:site-specific integrase [Nonomuraea sp. NPDC050404]|uniref:site-specific integrase n=1 Tax=Nonomuraea sp. NPDC050404 TaxID=3155783 RepID=UPI0033DBE91D
MTKRRSRGDGGLHWDSKRERWIASLTVGWTPAGKRIVKTGSGKTKTEAKNKLREIIRDYEDGLTIAPGDFTVEQAVNDWLAFGLSGRSSSTVDLYTINCQKHVIPALGKRRLRDLSTEDVDKWLAAKSKTLSTRTLQIIRSCLNRAVRRAMARDRVKRNVVDLCGVPAGRAGRNSKAMTFAQADAVLRAAEGSSMHAYIVVSLLTGARTEELRALRWDHVDLCGNDKAIPSLPPYVAVWRSVRASGDTKTRKSRRTLALPKRCVEALVALQATQREAQGKEWKANSLVFASAAGTELDAANVRRAFRNVIKNANGMNPKEWTPRELRHSFVSLLSDNGLPLEEISRLVGHSSTATTEAVYRKQIRPVVQSGAVAMDRIFGTLQTS